MCTVLTFVVVLPFSACNKKAETWTTESTKLNDQNATKKDATTITFAVPESCFIDASHLKLFNELLIDDGHNYQLEIKHLESENYTMNLENELKNGNVDIAFLGLGDGSNNIIRLINSGLILNLDEPLSSDAGQAVYESFPKALWESVKCSGRIYSIPNANADDQGIYAAFNRNYIGDDVIDSWDGSIEGIYEIIKNVKWNDEVSPRFQYLLTDYTFDKMIRCEIRNGLLYDYDTMKIENPLESDKLCKFLSTLEQMKSDGFMSESVTYYYNTSYDNEMKNLESGKFLVALAVGEPHKFFTNNNIRIKKITPYLSSRINGSIGISKNTNNVDVIMDFLGLLYGEEKYGNTLMYGKQDEDYKLKDGLVVNMDGSDAADNFLTKLYLNLFINIHPIKGERYTDHRREEYFSFYNSVKLSPFIGFEADEASESAITKDLDSFLDSLAYKPLNKAINDYSKKLKSDGIDEYLSSVKKQWEDFQQ